MSVSIIITCYDYEGFVAEAIRSALAQTWPAEVIVVDDGSTDRSLEIIRSFADRIQIIAKENRGQMSAFQAGFAASRGDYVLFLDADDLLDPNCVEAAVEEAHAHRADDVQFPLRVEGGGQPPGATMPSGWDQESPGRRWRPPPTSGHLWRRGFLGPALAVDSDAYRICADQPLNWWAASQARVRRLAAPLGTYRIHGDNLFAGHDTGAQVHESLARMQATRAMFRARGVRPPMLLQAMIAERSLQAGRAPGVARFWATAVAVAGRLVAKQVPIRHAPWLVRHVVRMGAG